LQSISRTVRAAEDEIGAGIRWLSKSSHLEKIATRLQRCRNFQPDVTCRFTNHAVHWRSSDADGSDFMGSGGSGLNAPHVVEMGWLRDYQVDRDDRRDFALLHGGLRRAPPL